MAEAKKSTPKQPLYKVNKENRSFVEKTDDGFIIYNDKEGQPLPENPSSELQRRLDGGFIVEVK
jgi:hypothetical protein